MRPPPCPSDHPDYGIECQSALEPGIHSAMDAARDAGWHKADIVSAVVALVAAWSAAEDENRKTDAAIRKAKDAPPE